MPTRDQMILLVGGGIVLFFFCVARTEQIAKISPAPSEDAIRARICGPDGDGAMRAVVPVIDKAAKEALVSPLLWGEMKPSLRADVSVWISLCNLDGGPVEIRHGGTRKLLATYSRANGCEEK